MEQTLRVRSFVSWGLRWLLIAGIAGCGARTGLEVEPPVSVAAGNNAYHVVLQCNYVAPSGLGVSVGTPFDLDPATGEPVGPGVCLPRELNENFAGRGVATQEALLADCEERVAPLFASVLRHLAGAAGDEECAVSCSCGRDVPGDPFHWVSEPFNEPACDEACEAIEPAPEPTDRLADFKFATVARPVVCDEVLPTDPRPVCRPPTSDPPVRAPEGLLGLLVPESSGVVASGTALVTINGETRSTPVRGQVSFLGAPCPGGSCDVGMSFDLTARPIEFTGGFLDLGSVTFEGIRAGGAGLPGALTLDGTGAGSYGVGTVQAWGRATAVERVVGVETGRTTAAFIFENTDEVLVDVDWDGRAFDVIDAFSLPPGDDPSAEPAVSIAVSAHGDLINQPPLARIATPTEVECSSPLGAVVLLDARATSDPDGDIEVVVWKRGRAILDPRASLAYGSLVSVLQAPFTTETYSAVVVDEHFKVSVAAVDVEVTDTTAPTIGEVTITPKCLWTPNHRWLRMVLGEHIQAEVADACDSAPVLRIAAAESSEAVDGRGDGHTSPDVLFGETGLCVRSERSGTLDGRTYTVTLAADDRQENRSATMFTIEVPHDSDVACDEAARHALLSDEEAEALCTFGPAARPAALAPSPPRVLGSSESSRREERASRRVRGSSGGCAIAHLTGNAAWPMVIPWLLVLLTVRRRCIGS